MAVLRRSVLKVPATGPPRKTFEVPPPPPPLYPTENAPFLR